MTATVNRYHALDGFLFALDPGSVIWQDLYLNINMGTGTNYSILFQFGACPLICPPVKKTDQA